MLPPRSARPDNVQDRVRAETGRDLSAELPEPIEVRHELTDQLENIGTPRPLKHSRSSWRQSPVIEKSPDRSKLWVPTIRSSHRGSQPRLAVSRQRSTANSRVRLLASPKARRPNMQARAGRAFAD